MAAHLFVAVLAYHGVHLLRTQLRAHGLHWSWQSLREALGGLDAGDDQRAGGRRAVAVQPPRCAGRGPRPCASPRRRAWAVRAHRRRAAARG